LKQPRDHYQVGTGEPSARKEAIPDASELATWKNRRARSERKPPGLFTSGVIARYRKRGAGEPIFVLRKASLDILFSDVRFNRAARARACCPFARVVQRPPPQAGLSSSSQVFSIPPPPRIPRFTRPVSNAGPSERARERERERERETREETYFLS